MCVCVCVCVCGCVCVHAALSISFHTFLLRHLKLSETHENSVCYCYTSIEITDQFL